MRREPLFGVETEYAFSAVGVGPVRREAVLNGVMAALMRREPHLPMLDGMGVFLPHAGRCYVDAGAHPELTTPECTHPDDLVRALRANDRMLAEAARDYLAGRPADVRDVLLHKCNVDYSGSRATWGCHESYLYRGTAIRLPDHLIPFLASRVLFTGAGGFHPLTDGLDFVRSPRSFHIEAEVSNESTHHRGLYHTREEPLCQGGYRRVHIALGESLCSDPANWLKVATTALVLKTIEMGVPAGDRVALADAVAALHAFAGNPDHEAAVATRDGRTVTAHDIQRHYLAAVRERLGAAGMPEWAEEACRRWEETLDAVAQGAAAAAGHLDWAAKRVLYERQALRAGFAWRDVANWSLIVRDLERALVEANAADRPVPVDVVLGPGSPIADKVRQMQAELDQLGFSWERLRPFLELKERLLEADTRFSQVGEQGIAAALRRQGWFRLPGDDAEPDGDALRQPPRAGRARLRGEAIRRLAHAPGQHSCTWEYVQDGERMLDLSDPFAEEERWINARLCEGEELSAALDVRMLRLLSRLRRPERRPPAAAPGQPARSEP